MNADVTSLRRFLDESPSPWHAAATAAAMLSSAGFEQLAANAPWDEPVTKGFVKTRCFPGGVAPRPG